MTRKKAKSDDQAYEDILLTLGRDWTHPEVMASAMMKSPGMRHSYSPSEHDNFFNDIDVDSVIDAVYKRFPGMNQLSRESVAVHVLVACHEAYQAGIERAKDAMLDCI